MSFPYIIENHGTKKIITAIYFLFSAMSIAESSKEPGYGEESASPLMSSNSYALSHSSSFGAGGRGSIGSGSGSGGSHRHASNSSSLFSQQRTQL